MSPSMKQLTELKKVIQTLEHIYPVKQDMQMDIQYEDNVMWLDVPVEIDDEMLYGYECRYPKAGTTRFIFR